MEQIKIKDYLPLVKNLAYKICRKIKKLDYDDAVQYGCIGLLKSIENYKPELNFKFVTLARTKIFGAIYDGFIKERTIIKKTIVNKIETCSMEEKIDEELKIEDIIYDENVDIEKDYYKKELKIAIENACKKLKKIDKTIMKMRFEYNYNFTEIGRKVNLTPAGVTYRYNKTLKILKKELEKFKCYI